MIDELDISHLQFYGLIATIIIAAAFGIGGYIVAARRIKQPMVLFLVRFGVVFFVLFFLEVAILNVSPDFHSTMRNLTAKLVGSISSLFVTNHSVSGSIITLQNPYLVFNITAACLGGELFWTYIALVLAETSANKKQRLRGIFIGLSILIVFNLFRIIMSIYVEWLTGYRVHNLFYFFNMVFVLLVWAGWLRTLKPQTASRPA